MGVFSDSIKWFYEQLTSPVFSASVAGVIVFIMMYLEAKISKKEIHRRTYTKNILLVATIVGSIVFILTNYSLNPKIGKIVEQTAKTVGGVTGEIINNINYDTSDIFLGEPRF